MRCFYCRSFLLARRQMAIENSVSYYFYLRSSTVLTFSIATYPVCISAAQNRLPANITTIIESISYLNQRPCMHTVLFIERASHDLLNTSRTFRLTQLCDSVVNYET